ncbi:hypothetical protein APHAL10511_003192 [Amanita phalloides]|nr:hypothetical protein APHAL10511_003192 [Amanita phalloides]
MFIGARLLIEFELTFVTSGAPLLVMELPYPTQLPDSRQCTTCIYGNDTTVLRGRLLVLQHSVRSGIASIAREKRQSALKVLAYCHAKEDERDPVTLRIILALAVVLQWSYCTYTEERTCPDNGKVMSLIGGTCE